MNKFTRALEDLAKSGRCEFKAFGHSMLPLIKSGSKLSFAEVEEYCVGDVVFCKVKGRYIDAHLIKKIDSSGRFLIANNKNHENGWTRSIFAKLVRVNGKSFGH